MTDLAGDSHADDYSGQWPAEPMDHRGAEVQVLTG